MICLRVAQLEKLGEKLETLWKNHLWMKSERVAAMVSL